MLKHFIVAAAFAACNSLPAFAEECPAAKAMAEGQDALEQRKNEIQSQEWLLMEFLSTDAARANRKLFEQEVAKSTARVQKMSGLVGELASLPDGAPEQGTPACELVTRAKSDIEMLFDTRTQELEDLENKKFPFLRGCRELTLAALNLGENSRKPEAKPDAAKRARFLMQIGYGVQGIWARLDGAELDRFVDAGLADSPLPRRTRYAHLALWCLRHYQGAAVKPLEPATDELAKCANPEWAELGRCVDAVILKSPR